MRWMKEEERRVEIWFIQEERKKKDRLMTIF